MQCYLEFEFIAPISANLVGLSIFLSRRLSCFFSHQYLFHSPSMGFGKVSFISVRFDVWNFEIFEGFANHHASKNC